MFLNFCGNPAHFIQDKLEISIYFVLGQVKINLQFFRVNVGTFGQCRYNRTLSYFLDNFSATSVVVAMCNPDKGQ